MKKIIVIFILISSGILIGKEPSWIGYNIINKTNHELNIQVHCVQNCDTKKDPKCKTAYGYVLLVTANATVVNKKDAMSYECFDNTNDNSLIIEVVNTNGQIAIPTRILKNPKPKDYIISLDKNSIDIK